MDGCIFCKIVSNEITAKKIFEDENSIAFLDLYPAAKGHTLVIPKNHYATLLDIPEMELKEVSQAIQKVAAAVVKATNAEGFNLVQNNREAAGQVVHHIHFHIVPRHKDDGLKLAFGSKEAEPSELAHWETQIKKHI
ncbi:MAG: HIT family protein [Candidatus Diapherotrites archaeon CG11_big_fil_rev_8_21_14_0_20_37_9]|nr:MAG: HIT family protein [Candidatus Diapherotrites archaeon CG11_big_fil_rev_8_21_14_0_20_37_9]